MKLVAFGIQQFRSSYISIAILFGITGGIMPKAAWSHLPKFFFNKISTISGNNSSMQMVIDTGYRVFSSWYNYVTWRFYSNYCILGTSVALLTTSFCLYSTLIVLQRKLQNKVGVQRVNLLKIYMEIQLLTAVYNETNKMFVAPAFVLIPSMGFCFCVYTLIMWFDQLDVTSILVFSNGMAVSVATLVLCFHFAAKMHITSARIKKDFVTRGRGNCSPSEWRRCCMVLSPVKVYIGSGNFFERLTQPVIFDFWVTNTISLILMGK